MACSVAHGRIEVLPSADQLLRWRVAAISAGFALASVAVIAVGHGHQATTTSGSSPPGWCSMAAAMVAGSRCSWRVPRAAGRMGMRRAASFGVVMAVLCATLGLAVYSQTRIHDCPATGPCAPAAPGKGQRPQLP